MEQGGKTPTQQLRMIWPQQRLKDRPMWAIPEGYALRTYRTGDEQEHIRLMKSAGFSNWNEESLNKALPKCLPDGFFVIVHTADHRLVATAMATHNPIDHHPSGGELGWVAADPEHRGKGLGYCVCAAATARFLNEGYSNLYLRTDDFRLPAIKTYIKLGWIPFLFLPDMEGRWRTVCRHLGLDFETLPRVTVHAAEPQEEASGNSS